MEDPRLILLDPRDTVLVARRRLRAGDSKQYRIEAAKAFAEALEAKKGGKA